MVSSETARFVVGVIGNVLAFILFLSPMPTFIRICKKKSVEQYSPIPYLATFVNCGLWVLYALPMVHPKSLLVLTLDGVGLVIEIIYLVLFIAFSTPKQRKLKLALIMLGEFLFVAVLACVVLTTVHTTKLRSTIVGSICMASNIAMFASPLSVMKMVIATKSVEFMPFFLSLAAFATGVSWTVYALIRFDLFIFVPNLAGILLSLAQFLLYAIFYKSTQRQLAERRAQVNKVGIGQTNFGDPKSEGSVEV